MKHVVFIKSGRLVVVALLIACAHLLTNCSSSQQQVEDETLNANGEQSEQAEAVNNSGGDEFESNNQEFTDGEQVNNAAEEEFADNESLENPKTNELNLGGEQVANANAAATNATNIPANLTNAAALPVTDTAVATDAAAPLATPAPTSGGVVKYVRSSTPIADAPGGTSVGSLEQGDHPLVWDDGQYAKMPNGKVIPSSSLSDKGIGRARSDASWRNSGE